MTTINFCKIETTVTFDEETYVSTETTNVVEFQRDCQLISVHNVVAYRYNEYDNDRKKQDKISVYATQKIGDESSPIYEDFWYIKLTVKDEEKNQYIYINFIRAVNPTLITYINADIKKANKDYVALEYENLHNTKNIIDIIKAIASNCGINKIVLQDDAEYPCNNDLIYGIKALQLRALTTLNLTDGTWRKPGQGKLSIYQSYGFIPTQYTDTEIIGSIQALQSITCGQLKQVDHNLQQILTHIKEKEKELSCNIRRMTINKDSNNLEITYSDVKPTTFQTILNNYIKNLNVLISLLNDIKVDDNRKIGILYDEFCGEEKGRRKEEEKGRRKEEKTCCDSRGQLLGCLKNSVNSYVIVIKGFIRTSSCG
jgi:hypothetical protein